MRLVLRFILRLAPALLLCAAMQAAAPESCVPARWNGGPLEAARRSSLDPLFAAVLKEWYGTRSLDLLSGTPINCLLVPWSTQAEPKLEAEHRRILTSFIREAHGRGIAVVGVLYPGADPRGAAESAAKANLDGLALEGGAASDGRLLAELRKHWGMRPVIPLGGRDALRAEAGWTIWATEGGVPPRVRITSGDGAVMATTTSEPWIESNTWLVQALLAAGGSRPVWLGYTLAEPAIHDSVRAIADASIAGGRWIVSLDDRLQVGLWRRETQALAAWQAISAALRHFEQIQHARPLRPVSVLGIVRDPAFPYPEVAGEYLNLIHRRRIPFTVIERRSLTQGALVGLKAVLAVELAPPSDSERALLEGFAKAGGTLVAGPSWAPLKEGEDEFVTASLGSGELILCRQEICDPDSMAREMVDWIGAGNLPVRVFNAPSGLTRAWRAESGRSVLVHLVNYASSPSERVTVRVQGRFPQVRLMRPGAEAVNLKPDFSGSNTEVRVERLEVVASLLFEE
ncbi:MAG: hypothetical protein K6T61_06980 [Bryobacteraceae bacterium]|nr:hypothetical protein [Bryobacteraceae bacterium]